MRKRIASALDSLAAYALGLVYDDSCPVCQSEPDSTRSAPLCRACWSRIIPYAGPSCSICARPFASPYTTICGECMRHTPKFHRAVVYGLYERELRDAILALKFRRRTGLARLLGGMLAGRGLPKADCIVPVPMSIEAQRVRGFNQTVLLGRVVAKETGLPLMPGLLTKVRETHTQVGLTRAQRLSNLRKAFVASGDVRGRDVLLLDDVITTGATAQACTSVLLRAGAGRVSVSAIARTF